MRVRHGLYRLRPTLKYGRLRRRHLRRSGAAESATATSVATSAVSVAASAETVSSTASHTATPASSAATVSRSPPPGCAADAAAAFAAAATPYLAASQPAGSSPPEPAIFERAATPGRPNVSARHHAAIPAAFPGPAATRFAITAAQLQPEPAARHVLSARSSVPHQQSQCQLRRSRVVNARAILPTRGAHHHHARRRDCHGAHLATAGRQ